MGITTNCQPITAVIQIQLFIRVPQSIKANLQGSYELGVQLWKVQTGTASIQIITEKFGQGKGSANKMPRMESQRQFECEYEADDRCLDRPRILTAQLPMTNLKSTQKLELTVSLESSSTQKRVWQFKYRTTITLAPFRRFIPMSLNESIQSTLVEVLLHGFVVRVQNVRCSAYQRAQQLLKQTQEYLMEEISQLSDQSFRCDQSRINKQRPNKLQLTSNTAFKALQLKIKGLGDQLVQTVLGASNCWAMLDKRIRGQEQIFVESKDTQGFYDCVTEVFQEKSKWKTIPQVDSVHLVVLVHGMNGNSIDFKKIKQHITSFIKQDNIVFFASRANQGKTDFSLQLQGQGFAEELLKYLNNSPDTVGKISFIGHSLGGLIIRAALPHLTLCAHRLEGFISLSTPHLGYLESSKLLGFGIRLLMKSKSSYCIKQLLFQDSDRVEDCYLSRLANFEGLNWFKRIVFIGALQDKYIPIESALVTCTSGSTSKMSSDLLKGLTASTLVRYSINFSIAETSFDSLIGRTAHLRFLQDKTFSTLLATILHSWH